MTTRCERCGGKGEVHDTELFRGRYCDIWIHCHACNGTGTIVDPDPEPPVPAAIPVVAPAVGIVLAITFADGRTQTRRPLEAQAADWLAEWLARDDVAHVRWTVRQRGQGSWEGWAKGAGHPVPVRIDHDARTGRHLAHSTTVPGRVYAIDGQRCSCPGFQYRGHCRHLTAFAREERIAA